MKKGYIIEKYNNMNNAYSSARLMEEGRRAGFDMQLVGVFDTVDKGGTLVNGGVLENAEFAVNRYKYGNLKDSISALCKKSINTPEVINKYIDKSRQRELARSVLKHPDSVLANVGVPFEFLAETLGLPFVAKGLCGSQGSQVYLIENEEQYKDLGSDGSEMLFQQFIKTSFGRDVRMLAVRGEVVGCMQRKSKSGFRANFALGAEVTGYEADSDIKKTARVIFEQTGADVLGIDLLFGSEGYVFCEINVTPGIEGIERAAGVNAAERIIALAAEK